MAVPSFRERENNLGILFLILALLSSLSVALVLRWSEERSHNRLAVIATNYVSAALLALAFGSSEPGILPAPAFLLGVGLGFLFLAGFLVFGAALLRQGMAASVTMGRISLVIPVGAAMIFFKESPSVGELTALALVLVVIWVWEGGRNWPAPILLLLFFIFGLTNLLMKILTVYFPGVSGNHFLAVVFGTALAVSTGVRWLRRVPLNKNEFQGGLILGVPNFFSAYFLVRSLERLPAYVVFPVIDVGVIVLSALAGILLFGERQERRKWFCLLLAVAALFLLGLSSQRV